MSNTTRFVAAIGLAGAVLMQSPAASAQQTWRGAYAAAPAPLADCYYNIGNACRPAGAYAAIQPTPYGAFAAIGPVNGSYPARPLRIWQGLRGSDWVAVHGAGP